MCPQSAAPAETERPRFPAMLAHITVAVEALGTAVEEEDARAERFAERFPEIPPVGRMLGKAALALAETVPMVEMALTAARSFIFEVIEWQITS